MDFINKTFSKDEEVHIDGNKFVGCKFDNCIIIYAGGPPASITECTFIDVKWRLEGAAWNTIGYLASLYHGMGENGRKLVENLFESIRKGKPPTL